ncbi:PAS domain S-box protein [Chlorobaculum sp. 24CR]|nr:PAS domain S-box protein [Chlorobaculum sp. 24CR]
MNDNATMNTANSESESVVRHLEAENAELKKELNRLSLVIEGTNAGYWDWNIQTGLVSINRAWAEMIGFTQEELGQVTIETWESFCHAGDLRKATELLEGTLRGETDFYEAEVRMRHKNGHWVWILDRGKVFERDVKGVALRMTGSHQDITERKVAEEQLRKEHNLFLEGPVTVFRWLNRKGYPTEYVSANVTALLGYAPSDFTSGIIAYADIIHPDDLDRILMEIENYFADSERTSFEQEYRIIRKDGQIAWIYDFTTIIRNDDGAITSFEGYVLDNTIRKQSEQEVAYNRRFEHLISTLANEFISASAEEIDAMIDKALEAIGKFVHADRSYIFQYYDNQKLMDNTHEWCAEGIEPQIDILQHLPTAEFEWSTKKITAGEVIIVPEVSELPNEAASEREILQQQDIQSLILIPLVSGNVPFGYIGFDAVREEREEWPTGSASILSLAGGIIANALQRQQVRKLLQSELDLALKLSASQTFEETMQHCLKTAMEISGMDSGAVYLLDENEKTLKLFQSKGTSNTLDRELATFTQNTPEYQIVTSGKAVYSDQNPVFREWVTNTLKNEGLKCFAVLPVFSKNRPVATFNIGSHTLDHVPEYARKALETVTSHVGAAIMQAKHEERVSTVNRNLETLFESIDDMLFILAGNGSIVHANSATVNALGYSLDELRAMNVLEVHPPELRKQAQQKVEAMLAGAETLCDIPLLMKSGEKIPVETKITRGVWDGKPVLFGITRNVSERLKNQAALVESERKFRELTENLPFPLFETDLQGAVSYINLSGMEFFDVSAEEVKEEISAFSFCWPENLEPALANQQKIFYPGYSPKGNEYTIVMRDGREAPLLLYNSPIRKEGKFAGMRTTAIDLTELKLAEAALHESALQKRISEEFRAIISNIPGLVYHLSSDNRARLLSSGIQPWSQALMQSNHVESLDDAIAFVHAEDRQLVIDAFNKLRARQSSTTITFRIPVPGNEVKWVENRSTSVFSEEGAFTGIDGILFDVTDRLKAQEENQQLQASLQKTQRLETIGTLAGGIAHDFNNILSPILGYAEMGVLLMPTESKPHEFFRQIMLAGERAQNLVAQILTFSRSEESEPIVVNVQPIVKEALKLLRPSIPVTVSIETRFGKCGNVLGDPTQLHQVIMNLCTNAFQAMPESGGKITIELAEMTPGSEFRKKLPNLKADRYAQLTVADTGCGMDAETMERVFEPFFTTKAVNKGTGLGLSVVHGIVNSFSGDITVESLPGNGSTFRVFLPIIEEEAMIEKIDNEPDENQSNARVLFVDDELAAIEVMRVMMGHLGFNIVGVNSPIEALAEFHKDPDAFDLVITDLTMPEMTGIELAKQLHELNPKLRMILMTGYGKSIENPNSLSRYGICRMLKKPVRLNKLAEAIKQVISGQAHL